MVKDVNTKQYVGRMYVERFGYRG